MTRQRIPELDAVRGMAAVGVVLFHAFPRSPAFIGSVGVDLFFVLSGFLITGIILREHKKEGFLRDFYTRRIARIWPVYYITLAAVLVLNGLSTKGYPTDELVYTIFFLQGLPAYWGGAALEFPYAFGPSWSVAFEEQFYAIWPLMVIVLGRRAPAAAVCLIVVPLASRALSPETRAGTRPCWDPAHM